MQILDRRHRGSNNDEVDLKEIVKAIARYKWSILAITLLALLIAIKSIYFRAPLYNAETLLEVKNSAKKGMPGASTDLIGSAFSDVGGEKVDKEIEILKTFLINNMALEKINYNTRFFFQKDYKKVEIYNNIPVKIDGISIHNKLIESKLIKLIPRKNGYSLEVENSLKSKLLNYETIDADSTKKYTYNQNIHTDYFDLTINKDANSTIEEPIYFNIVTDNRDVYDYIVSKNLEIKQVNQFAPLIKISYKDTIRERARKYVDALAESFILQSIEEKSKKNNKIIDFINSELKKTKKKLDESEQELEEYRIKHKAINSDIQAKTYMTDLSDVEFKLNKNRLNKAILEDLLGIIKTTDNIDSAAPLLEKLQDATSLALIKQLQTLQTEAESLKNRFSNRYPQVIAMNKQISYLKNKIKKNIRRLGSGIEQKNKSLMKLKDRYEDKIKDIPTQERKLINLKRDSEVSAKTYNYLLEKKSENEMMKVAILSDYAIIEKAYANKQYINLRPMYVLLSALLLGLILGIIQALTRNFIDDRIMSKEDVTHLTKIPIYGILPKLNQKKIKLEVLKDPKSPFAESYRSLRTNLQFSSSEKSCNVILVTSTVSAEGKSTISANLSAIFQMADYKCIVINMDLRKPTLHNYFNIDNNLGMSTYLSGRSSIVDIIHPSTYEKLDLIPSGPIPPNPSELILSNKMDDLIDNLKEVYDYIIIDSAPLGLVTDTMHLMQYADINLIVVRENYSRKLFISDLNQLVEKHDLKHIGIVLNSVNMTSDGYGYGYGYGYG